MPEFHLALHTFRRHVSPARVLLGHIQQAEHPSGCRRRPLHLAEAVGDLLQRRRKLAGK